MAIYNYRCEDCGEEFEVSHLIDEAVTECVECCSDNIKRTPPSSFMFLKRETKVFKGQMREESARSRDEFKQTKGEMDSKRKNYE